VTGLWLAALAATALSGAVPAAGEVERAIDVPRPGKVVVALDSDVYDAARADLADLRIFDPSGAEVPFLLDRPPDEPEEAPRGARIASQKPGPVRGAVTATLDFGGPFLKRELGLSLSGDDFRRRVTVEGRYRFEQQWTPLADAFVFAGAGPPPERYEAVPLTESNHQFLRVTVYGEPTDPAAPLLLEGWSRAHARRRPREANLAPALKRERDEAARQTVLTLDLRGRHQPYQGVLLDVRDAEFWRAVTAEAWEQGRGHPGLASAWRPVGRAAVYRLADGEARYEGLRLDVSGRGRLLRLRLHDGDQPPLDVRGALAKVPQEHLVFEAAPGRRYRLSYGRADRTAPSYEVQRTVADPAVWIAQASRANLGPPRRPAAVLAGLPPWRHPLAWAAAMALLLLGLWAVGRFLARRARC
jgi:hypothetical protein